MNTFKLANGTVTAGYDFRERFSKYESAAEPVYQTEHGTTQGLFAQARIDPTERLNLPSGLRHV